MFPPQGRPAGSRRVLGWVRGRSRRRPGARPVRLSRFVLQRTPRLSLVKLCPDSLAGRCRSALGRWGAIQEGVSGSPRDSAAASASSPRTVSSSVVGQEALCNTRHLPPALISFVISCLQRSSAAEVASTHRSPHNGYPRPPQGESPATVLSHMPRLSTSLVSTVPPISHTLAHHSQTPRGLQSPCPLPPAQ